MRLEALASVGKVFTAADHQNESKCAAFSRSRKASGKALEGGNVTVEQQLERGRHVAPVCRSTDNEDLCPAKAFSDAVTVIPRECALLLGAARHTAAARLYVEALYVHPLDNVFLLEGVHQGPQ